MAGVGMPASGLMMATPLQATTHQLHQQQEWVPSLIAKRIASWKYIARVLQGGTVLYNTALVSENEMRQLWSEEKMQRRSLSFFFLGTSLASILEIPNTIDCIKALNQVLQEYESFLAAEARSKSIFSIRKGNTDLKPFEETTEYSHLDVRNMPFNLDYVITASTLCDMVGQVYEKLRLQLLHEHVWPLITLEAFQKVDARFKKILMMVYKEIEAVAREVMVQELNTMDPLGLSASTFNYDDFE